MIVPLPEYHKSHFIILTLVSLFFFSGLPSVQMAQIQMPQSISQLAAHQCGVCGKIFANKTRLDRHSTVHTGRKDFVCETCSRGFTSKQSLKFHKYSQNH